MTITETSGKTSFYITGGTLPPNAPSYVERHADRDLYETLIAAETCYVLNSRQMGKSSLCVRTFQKLKQVGFRTVFCDLEKFGGRNLSAEQWYAALLSEVGRELGLRSEFMVYWKENSSFPPVQRLFGAITEVGLAAEVSPIVIFIDEIDITRSLPFSTDEFFAAIRQCYVGRATEDRLKQLSFCLLGTAAPADLIQDTRVSPFNIGKRIELRDFTPEETTPLAEGLSGIGYRVSGVGENNELLSRVLYWTGGHPYLTQRLCSSVAEALSFPTPDTRHPTPALVDKLCHDLFLTHAAKDSDDNLAFVRNRLLKSEVDLPTLLDLYRQMRSGKSVPDDETNSLCSILKLSGVAKVENGLLTARNRIYAHVFDKAWVASHMPDAELRRQKSAYRKGLLRAASIAIVVIAIMGGLAFFGFNNARIAKHATEQVTLADAAIRKERDKANLNYYIADMNVIQADYDTNNFTRINDLLGDMHDRTYDNYRGFEWGYWHWLCHLELMTFKGHTNGVSAVSYSPDGKRIVTGSVDHTAKLWDAETGYELLTLKGHIDRVLSVAFSPDGKRIITGSKDKTAKIWDSETGHEILTLKGHTDDVHSVAFSLDGKRIVTGSWDHKSKIWNAETGQCTRTLEGHTDWVMSAAFSPDGKRIVTGSADNTAIVWNAETGRKILPPFKGHKIVVSSAAFSPDGKRIVTGSYDNTAIVWNAETGRKILPPFKGHTNWVCSAVFFPDGKRILTGSTDNTAKIWDAETGHEILTLKGHGRGGVISAALSPDGKRIVTGGGDKTAKIWETATRHEILTRKGFDKFALLSRGPMDSISVTFSPDGKSIFTGSPDDTVKIWNARTGSDILSIKGQSGGVTSIAFSPNGKRIVTGSKDGTAKIWNAVTGGEIRRIKAHDDIVWSVAFSPDGKRVVTGSEDNAAKIWDSETGHMILMLEGHSGGVYSAAFSPDGKRVVTGSADKNAKIWDAETGHALLTLKGHDDRVLSVAFSPDGKRMVTGSWDTTAKIWNAETGLEILSLNGHNNVVFAVAFSPDGMRIVTGSADNTAKLWETVTGRELLTLKGSERAVRSVAFSPDGRRIVTGSKDGTVKIWFSPDIAGKEAH